MTEDEAWESFIAARRATHAASFVRDTVEQWAEWRRLRDIEWKAWDTYTNLRRALTADMRRATQ